MDEQRICPVCRGDDLKLVHTREIEDRFPEPESFLRQTNDYQRNFILFEHVLERRVEKITFSFFECENCGFIFFSPRPSDADLMIKYERIAASHETEKREQLRSLVDQRKRRGREIADCVLPHAVQESGLAVDVGGADGHCLGAMVDRYDCFVVDFETREPWPGVRRAGNTLDDVPEEQRFDVALCCHTLEHIVDPRGFVQSIRDRLSPGGVLYLEVPYGCAGEIHETNNFLTHLNFFSPDSLGHLLESCGLHVELVRAAPVLSRQRYLPVVQAVARRQDEREVEGRFLHGSASCDEARSLGRGVILHNVRLVLSAPLSYMAAFSSRLLRRFRT